MCKARGLRHGLLEQYSNIYYTYMIILYYIYYTISRKKTGMTYLPAMGHAHINLADNVMVLLIG